MTTADPTSYNKPDRKTLDAADLEAVASAVMALTREVWVLQDRQLVTEAILAERGIDIRDAIERFTPDEDLQQELNRRGEILTDAVMRALAGLDREDT